MKFKIFFLAFITLVVIQKSTFAQTLIGSGNSDTIRMGNEGARGGGPIASTFRAAAQDVVLSLKTVRANKDLLSAEKVAAIEKAISTTPIERAPGLLYDEDQRPVEALTVDDPESPSGKTIQVDFDLMLKTIASGAPIHVLVFHEYLWVIGEQDKYNAISKHLKMKTAVPNELGGSTWGARYTDNGVVMMIKISFDNNGNYSKLVLLAEDNNMQNLRGTWTRGEYKLENQKISFHLDEGSCPLKPSELGNNVIVTGSLNGNILNLESSSKVYLLKRDEKVIPIAPVRVGCIKPSSFMNTSVFTSFDDHGQMIGFPEIVLPTEIRSIRNAGQNQALAYSFGTSTLGKSSNYPGTIEAIRAAVKDCGKADCQLIAYAQNNCLAMAVAPNRTQGTSNWGPNRSLLETDVLNKCANKYGMSCELAGSICP